MKTMTRQSVTMSQNSNNSLWHGISVLPCIPAAAPSFSVGFLSYRRDRPDSC